MSWRNPWQVKKKNIFKLHLDKAKRNKYNHKEKSFKNDTIELKFDCYNLP